MRKTIFLAVIAASLALPAMAQSRLPRTSPAERETNRINQSIERKEELRSIQQQNQISNNQLRQSIERRNSVTNRSVLTGPGGLRTCPVGSVGC